jgi:hypothetical protein
MMNTADQHEFVGHRIKPGAQLRLLVELAGNEAVHPIGNAGATTNSKTKAASI